MSKIDTEFMTGDQDYEARGIIAKIKRIGFYDESILVRKPIYQYLTLDCGEGRPAICVRFVGEAPLVEQGKEIFLDMSKMKKGQIVVSPALLYEKIEFTSAIMVEHLKALKTYKRKVITIAEKAGGEAIDLGEINKPKG